VELLQDEKMYFLQIEIFTASRCHWG